MSDAAFATAAYPAYTTAQLEAAMERGVDDVTKTKMVAEISRRARVADGDRSVMTPGERLRNPLPA